MGNPLKFIFSDSEPNYKGSLRFKSVEDSKKFVDLLEQVNEEERMMPVPGIKAMERYIDTEQGKYLLEKPQGELIKLYIGPSYRDWPQTVQTDYGEYTFDFKIIKKKNEIVAKNDESAIVHVKIVADKKSTSFNFTYKTNPTKADSIKTIVKSLNALRKLMTEWLDVDTEKNIKEAYESLSQLEVYWKRVHELEKAFGIYIKPKNINDSIADEGDFEKAYLLIVKKLPIRENLNSFTTKMSHEDLLSDKSFEAGTHIAIAMNSRLELTIYGEEFIVFTANHIFNAIIGSIKNDKEKGEYTIKLIGTETKPLYNVYMGYVNPEEIPVMDDFNKAHKELYHAKTFNEHLTEVKNDIQEASPSQNLT